MFLRPLLDAPHETWLLTNARTAGVLARTIETAFDPKTRNRGLLGRAELPAGSAMILAPCSGIHTFFMQFSIDVAFVARDGRILRTRSTLQPWRMAIAFGAYAVVELPTGVLAATDTRPPDRLQLARE